MDKYEINPGIIASKLNIGKKDTILITIDIDKYDMEETYYIYKIINEAFPDNTVVCTFKGVDIKRI